jgi:hypothetical protein
MPCYFQGFGAKDYLRHLHISTSQIARANTPTGHELKRLRMYEDRVLSIILGSLKEVQAGSWRSCIKGSFIRGTFCLSDIC